jgi:hypothetical protein
MGVNPWLAYVLKHIKTEHIQEACKKVSQEIRNNGFDLKQDEIQNQVFATTRDLSLDNWLSQKQFRKINHGIKETKAKCYDGRAINSDMYVEMTLQNMRKGI